MQSLTPDIGKTYNRGGDPIQCALNFMLAVIIVGAFIVGVFAFGTFQVPPSDAKQEAINSAIYATTTVGAVIGATICSIATRFHSDEKEA